MKHPLVSIIIVNWNGGEIFKSCLESLAKINYSNWELIVVDNASSDGSDNFIKKNRGGGKSRLIRNRENVGFAKANNQGYQRARGDFILLLNNDTKVTSNFLSKLVSRIKDSPDIGIIQPKILLMDKPTHLDSVGSFLTSTGFLQHYGFLAKDTNKYNQESKIFSAKGACMLIRREAIEKVGLFDSSYVSYLEETDFCWRVWLTGYKILYYPKAKIYHKVGFSSKRLSQITVNYNSFKNRLATLFKNLATLNLIVIGGFHLVIIIGLSFYYLIRLKFSNFSMIWRAIYWNVVHLPQTNKKRQKVQRLRIKRDAEIFEHIKKPIDWKSMLSHFVRSEKMMAGEHEV